jgi:hypothetical protein
MSILRQDHLSLTSHPLLPEEGPLNVEVTSSDPEALETVEGQGEGEVEVSSKRVGSS